MPLLRRDEAREIAALADENTKAIYVETISNPSATVPDFEAIKAIAAAAKVPLICDNTFGMGGYTCKPIAFGADIVVESATKWIGGHGTSIGGVITDGSSFDWRVKGADGKLKFPLIADKQASYHDAVFVNHPVFGVEATNTVFILLARVKTLRDMGGCIAPFNCSSSSRASRRSRSAARRTPRTPTSSPSGSSRSAT